MPWAMVFPGDMTHQPRHPSQLYEAGLEGIGLFLLLAWLFWRTDARYQPGKLTGAFLLGYGLIRVLLENFRATIHWENLSALREEFPRVLISDQLFTIDRTRFTCSGGTAPLDLMLNLIETKLGSRISQRVSEQFIVDRVRKDKDRQYIPLRARVGVSHRGLIRVAQLMEENIEKPLSLEKIAKATGLSRRQIERLFKRDLNCVPKRYYLEMRLRRARELLLQTAMPIMDITAACGFQSPPHFSKCYRNQYGYPPSAERKIGEGRAGTEGGATEAGGTAAPLQIGSL